MEASSPSSNIPNEIIRIILLQLSVESIIRFQCVSKLWRSMIQDSDFKLSYGGPGRLFILSHESERRGSQNSKQLVVRFTTRHDDDLRLERQKWPLGEAADYPLIRGSNQYHVTALSSCNGFVLLAAAERDILLWNPLTRCLTKVLESPYSGIKSSGALAGLCYYPRTRNYKVVLLFRHLMDYDNPWCVISASLTHKNWRSVQFPYCFDSIRDGVSFRNTFHWWVSDIPDPYWYSVGDYPPRANKNRIIYFDYVRDEFRILPTPSEQRENSSIVGLGVIDDCLSMACIPRHNEAKTNTLQVLIMKEYGIEESWMIAFDIQMPQLTYGNRGLTFYSQPNNTEQVLFMRRGLNRHHVYVYDREKDERKEVLMDFLKQSTGLDENFASMFFYVENFDCLALQPHDYIFS
ncbi:PREDICTED: F-box/kelch-repeat protein At3g23880-like [Ipomoea nil]|uniref:F-box/kelch-repeat protein At3g23880-like n=1 Tax=Ipomoea nil TaxID=35883 RepID=UPI000901F6B2|nr:PREDICTED: F-box/kelch-repeat protein At3g23880-like [Ipomoea nil]